MARQASLIWTAPALDDLDDIAGFIALDDRSAAAALVERTLAALERLRRHPDSGRWVPEIPGDLYREVIVPPCRVIYRRQAGDVLIVHVLRGEQRLRPSRLQGRRRKPRKS
jgi:plasmid stabilization system protein ParE